MSFSPDARPRHERAKVVLSIDFELRWGVHDVHGMDRDAYRHELEQGRQNVPALLAMLAAHGVRATWAVVGALGCENWDEYFRRAPAPPRYADPRLAIQPRYADLDPGGELHFAPELVRAVVATPGQEVGTHTFSHLYLREAGVTAEDVRGDLTAARALHEERFGVAPRALVFPRNQPAFVDVVRACGIRIWRGNPPAWHYECEDSARNGLVPRALKLVDDLACFTARRAPVVEDMTRASLFLRFNLPTALWTLQVNRIERELAKARPGEVFHLWFHPHNLGRDRARRMARLEQVLQLVAKHRERGTVESCSMGDLVSGSAQTAHAA